MPYRSQCGCPCHHRSGVMHMFACCEPDPYPAESQATVDAVPCEVCKSELGEPCTDTYPSPLCRAIRIRKYLEVPHMKRCDDYQRFRRVQAMLGVIGTGKRGVYDLRKLASQKEADEARNTQSASA